jgi:hypothetical protein
MLLSENSFVNYGSLTRRIVARFMVGTEKQTKSLDGGKPPLISYFTFCSKLYMYKCIFSTLEMALKIFLLLGRGSRSDGCLIMQCQLTGWI